MATCDDGPATATDRLTCQVHDTLTARVTRQGQHKRLRLAALQDTTPVSLQTAGLDLSEYCSEVARQGRPVYDLVAVSSHSGGLGGGHYTAQCKSLMDGQWRDYNDASVSKINPFTVSSDEPYVLFWRRQ